ncbi:MAG TPA: HEAT repeat domain-containing protein [Vicinamibacteria bacterium]|nr:HEAT repeat domain-containing protein [Vicinamibacteria bacterium]
MFRIGVSLLCLAFLPALGRAEQPDEQAAREQERAAREQERIERAEEVYERATDALDVGQWEAAVHSFSEVVRMGGRRADGALYWKAYALGKLGKKAEALTALAELKKADSASRWASEAKALELELRGAAAASPDAQADEEMKLLALNALMNSDEGRAIPLLEGFLKGNHSPRLKDRALFVLSQSESARAREILVGVARSGSNPDLQMRAIRYLGLSDDPASVRALSEIYASTSDVPLKRAILRAFMTADDAGPVFAAAKAEKEPELRREAIRQLGAMEAKDELLQLYKAETSVELREEILQALGVAEATQTLGEIARTEADLRLRRAAIHGLGINAEPPSGAILRGLYAAEKDLETRKAVLEALFIQDDARGLIEIARAEKDPALRRAAVEKLSVMDSREAQDYMLEILQK